MKSRRGGKFLLYGTRVFRRKQDKPSEERKSQQNESGTKLEGAIDEKGKSREIISTHDTSHQGYSSSHYTPNTFSSETTLQTVVDWGASAQRRRCEPGETALRCKWERQERARRRIHGLWEEEQYHDHYLYQHQQQRQQQVVPAEEGEEDKTRRKSLGSSSVYGVDDKEKNDEEEIDEYSLRYGVDCDADEDEERGVAYGVDHHDPDVALTERVNGAQSDYFFSRGVVGFLFRELEHERERDLERRRREREREDTCHLTWYRDEDGNDSDGLGGEATTAG